MNGHDPAVTEPELRSPASLLFPAPSGLLMRVFARSSDHDEPDAQTGMLPVGEAHVARRASMMASIAGRG
jgi:hypothetical protein